jgi:hypothetical protein
MLSASNAKVRSYVGLAVHFLAMTWLISCGATSDPAMRELEMIFDRPIECHVRFEDQNGKPIANTRIQATIITETRDGTDRRRGLTRTTDKEGTLHIQGEHGGYLVLRVMDPAYAHGSTNEFDPGGTELAYSTNHPYGNRNYGTRESPAVYQVWEKEGAQPLISIKGDADAPFTGAPLRIDLMTGEIVDEGGDIILAVKQPLTEEEMARALESDPVGKANGRFPWSCEILVPDGGLYEIGFRDFDLYTFGVMKRPTVKSKLIPYGRNMESFYSWLMVDARNGLLHGKVNLEVRSGSERRKGKVMISIIALINGTGSRSLEVDPQRLTEVKFKDARKLDKGK